MKTEIDQFEPCTEAVEFRQQFSTFEEAWKACPRGDWMLWIARKLSVDEKKLSLAKGLCAQTAIHLMRDERSVNAVNAAIAYGQGLMNEDELKKASYAAYKAYVASGVPDWSEIPTTGQMSGQNSAAISAYDCSYIGDEADAAGTAASIADAVYIHTMAETDSNKLASAYAPTSAYATLPATSAAEAAKNANQKQTADICREVLTDAVLEKISKL